MIKYNLIPHKHTKFRIGKTDWYDSDDMIHSDTLFSAIVNCYSLLFGNTQTNEFVEAFKSHKINISSVFYTIDIRDKINTEKTIASIDFYPKPFNIAPAEKKEKDIHKDYSGKKAKKIKFVSKEALTQILNTFNGHTFTKDLQNQNHFNYLGNEFIYTKDEFSHDFTSVNGIKKQITESKNAIDRKTARVKRVKTDEKKEVGQLFDEIDLELKSIERKDYIIQPSMFFLAEIQEKYKESFDAAVGLMCDEGLGGERAFGKGIFKGFGKEYKYNFANKSPQQPAVLLSMLNPKNEIETFKNNIVGYDSIMRGGWVYDDPIKNVRMIKEGSVFNSPVTGTLVDVTPGKYTSHPVLKNGIGFYI